MVTCSVCDDRMTQGQIKCCVCRVICVDCARPFTKCEECFYTFTHEIRAIKLHQRIMERIGRPCKYKRDGCNYFVMPRDEHEMICEYQPVQCAIDMCNVYVSKIFMQVHFEETHFLKSTNLDVKLTDFYLEDTGSRRVKCVTREGYIVYITIFNLDGMGDFNQFTVVYSVTNLKVRVKLNFDKDGYMYSRSTDSKTPISTDGQIRMTFIDVHKEKFDDWINGICKLNIKVAVKKKRQLKAQKSKLVTGRTKTVKKKIKKGKHGVDKKVMKSLQHKQRRRNEYLKMFTKANMEKSVDIKNGYYEIPTYYSLIGSEKSYHDL